MLDENLLLRDGSSNLDADDLTPTGLDFGEGGDLRPLTYIAQIPEAEASTTLDITIQVSDDDVTYVDWLVFPQVAAADCPVVVRVTGRCPHRYRRAACDVTGSIAGNGFGAVLIAPELGGEYESY